jgi:hypothetical protein
MESFRNDERYAVSVETVVEMKLFIERLNFCIATRLKEIVLNV